MKRLVTACLVAVVALAARADAQAQNTTNAALRYWMAFAMLKDPPADRATVEVLDRVAAGTAPWDEAKLGRILSENREALGIMRRASTLPSCDWGLEYDLGPRTPVAHVAKARVLGRLNGVAAASALAHGQKAEAADIWLAGVRFSQHVARDGTLIGLLTARLSLSASLKALTGLASDLDPGRRKEIAAAVSAIPDAGFDWADAMRREAELLAIAKTVDPTTNATMPSQARVDQVAAAVRAERKALLDALSGR
jgi:hypothetical protein